MIVTFNHVEVDESTCEVRVDGSTVHVEPQVYDVLTFLIHHRDRVVTKEELLDEVWGSRFVSESALTSRIKSARGAVGDSGQTQHTIRTVHGKGYQFIAPVREIDDRSGKDAHGEVRGGPTFAAIRRPDNGFHGRQRECAEVSALLDEHRLVTIVGHGGTGKTRLSLEVVHARGDTAAFVDLAAVRDGGAIAQALVAALGIDVGSGEDEVTAATTFLRGIDAVLVVDNCEHVLEPAAAMVQRILAEAPTVVVLATSRRALGLRDEHVVRLDPLPLVDATTPSAAEAASNPAVSLFLDRAQQASRWLNLDEVTTPQVVSLCRALDGLPLALELAAGRASTFALDDLLARLDRRLDLLGDDRADTHERHRSLRATLDWSFDQLDPACQTLFLHLSVFPAGVTLEGAEWLVERLGLDSDPLRVIDRLVAASLVDRVDHPSGSRYVLLETMRTFGLDRLTTDGRIGPARDLQVELTFELLDALRATGQTEHEFQWDDRIRRELANIRYARQHLRETGRHQDLLRVSVALDLWAMFRDASEIWVWADELRDLTGWSTEEQDRVRALGALAAWRRGRVVDAATLGAQAAESDDRWARERGLNAHGAALLFSGEFDAAADAWLEASRLSGSAVDQATAALPLAYAGRIEHAREVAGDAHRRATDAGWPTGVAWTSYVVGEVEATAGHGSARDLLEQAVTEAKRVGSSFTYGVASVTLCSLLAEAGDHEAGTAWYRDLITHWLRSGSWTQLWTTLRNAVALICDTDPALCLLTLDLADGDPLASRLDEDARAVQDELRARLADRLGPDRVAEVAGERAMLDRVGLAARVRAALDERHRQLTGATPSPP